MIYLDSNLFIYAALSSDDKGKKAAEWIRNIREGTEKACTSALTFDELVYKVKKHRGTEEALMAGSALLNMKNLAIVPTDAGVLWKAHSLIQQYGLDPRDAIHAASAIQQGAKTILSEDKDFDAIKEIKRKWIF